MKLKTALPVMAVAALVCIAVGEYSDSSRQAMAQGQAQRMIAPPGPPTTPQADSYYSPKLKAALRLEWMSIPGFSFWGGRIVGMAPDSPLHQANLHPGDVITRLDGVKISKGKFWTGQYWSLPQIERHYGRSEVRHIRSGQQNANNAYVDLGSSCFPSFPGPIVP